VFFEYICWKFTRRLLDRVNILLDTNEDVAQMFQFKRVTPWLHAPISSSEMLSDVTEPSGGITAVDLRMCVNFFNAR